MKVWLVFLVAAGALSCANPVTGGASAPCTTDKQCKKPFGCFDAPFPDKICSADCSVDPCPAGAVCALVVDRSLCVASCVSRADCHDGYQCFDGGCVPNCVEDIDCGQGFRCADGECMPYDGAAVGEPCGGDAECSTRLCEVGKCAKPCNRDALCDASETCALPTALTAVRTSCIPRRGSSAPGAACLGDKDCDRGNCKLGVCVEMCATTQDCHSSGMTCAGMSILLEDDSAGKYRACLPSAATLSFPADDSTIPFPDTGKSFAIYVASTSFNLNAAVGVTELIDPTGAKPYVQPASVAEFFASAIRYQPDDGASTMLVPNAPTRFSPTGGLFRFQYGSSISTSLITRGYIKVSNSPISTGKVSLNFYVPNLSDACQNITVSSGQGGALAGAISRVQSIFQQVGITVTDVNWKSAPLAKNSIARELDPMKPQPRDLEDALRIATNNQGTTPGFDVVLVRTITDAMGQTIGILGIAGGIPGSPINGTPHSGVVVSVGNLCMGGQQQMGIVIAHEVGHSLGLFHNQESSQELDPLTDTGTEQTNLMYWLENSGMTLSAQQGQVVRNDPKVRF